MSQGKGGGGYQGHRKDGWTEFEQQVIYDYAQDPTFLPKVAELLPNRTPSAIYQRMRKLRIEAGLLPDGSPMLGAPDDAIALLAELEDELRGGDNIEGRYGWRVLPPPSTD